MRTTTFSVLTFKGIAGSALGVAHVDLQRPVVLRDKTVAIEAEIVECRLHERCLAMIVHDPRSTHPRLGS